MWRSWSAKAARLAVNPLLDCPRYPRPGKGEQLASIRVPHVAAFPLRAAPVDQSSSSPPAVEGSSILIVDDEPRNILLLQRALEAAGFQQVVSTTDPFSAIGFVEANTPDLVILDLHMPGLDGFGVLTQLGLARASTDYLPVLVLTADATEPAKRRALTLGARDFLTKPFGVTEAILRIRNLLETRALYSRLEAHNRDLADRVAEQARELESARMEVLERLCQAVEFRDDITGRHTRRVGEKSAALASAVSLPAAEVDLIRRAAPLHDVGKIGVPDAILHKTGRLTDDELEVMRCHTLLGGKILAGGRTELMETAEAIARSHHERWDGTGYPDGLSGETIPLAARIVAIADVFDAVTTPRQYRSAWSRERAVEELRRGIGSHFDPGLVEPFLSIVRESPPGSADEAGSVQPPPQSSRRVKQGDSE